MSQISKTVQIQSLIVGFSIIDFVAESPQPVKFNEIHNHTGITKSNLYKYLNTLTSIDVLHRDKNTGLYSGGPSLVRYGMATVNNENIVSKVNPYLEEINIFTKETTLLTLWTMEGPMIIKMIHSQAGLNLGGRVGTVLPINSASGKIYSSLMKGPSVEVWIAKELQNKSEKEVELFKTNMKIIQKKGIAFAKNALAPSIASVAIPIFNFEDSIIGAITVVGFEETVPTKLTDELSSFLLEKSKEISKLFGYIEGIRG